MTIYIKETSKSKGLYLYNPENNQDITLEFFDMIILPDMDGVVKLSNEEKKSFNTTADYLISTRNMFNTLVCIVNKQQALLDSAIKKSRKLLHDVRTLSI